MEMRKLRGITRKFSNDRRRMNRKLKKAGIKFHWSTLFDGYQWFFPDYPNGDIALHWGTYGANQGYFESYCMPWDEDDVSVCTADEMVEHLLKGK